MATGGSRGEDPNTCAVCLRSYREPRLLDCHHTFCTPCIQDIAVRHRKGDIRCPICGGVTALPPGGVASLQANFYIQTLPSPHKPVSQDICKIYDEKKLEIYCARCDKPILSRLSVQTFLNCKLTKHDVTKRKKNLNEERRSLAEKRAAVEKEIHNRHAAVVAAADVKRDEELRSLQCQHADMDRDVVHAVQQQEATEAELSDLLTEINTAMTSGTATDVIHIAKEMTSGRGSQQTVAALTSQEAKSLYRPVLRYNVGTDVMMQTTRDYMGSVCKMEMKVTGPEVKVTERFQCAQDPDVEVFSLCHVDDDPPGVCVSYERCGMKEDAPVKGFTETGECVYTGTGDDVGKVSSKRIAKGMSIFLIPQPGIFTTFCKTPTAAHLQLKNHLSGQGDINRVTVTSTDPFTPETKPEFSIQVGPHRAFDVDDTEQYFAVVEEAQESTSGRSVRLYRRSVENAVSTYSPPTDQYQPSDVCFYSLGGQKVLLITDQLNDAIHVVSIQWDRLKFERYLCAGCPSITKPAAITVDIHGRLWLACGGGSILTIEKL